MLNNVALDVCIGLIFVYLLYSLLATVIAEIIATYLGLRARNLKEAVDRMLNDEKEKGFFARTVDTLKLMKNPNNPIIKNFYNHPEIKYLGSSGIFKLPSSFKAISFSKTLLYSLNGPGHLYLDKIKTELEKKGSNILGPETSAYVLNMLDDVDGDVIKFKQQLETWFDRTMEQATEWYKRKIQLVLLLIGFLLACIFNADTLAIVKKLSTDKDARDKLVTLASAYIQNNPGKFDTSHTSATQAEYNKRLDSLLKVKKQLETDIENAGSVLGSGTWLPDSITVKTDATGITYVPAIQQDLLLKDKSVHVVNGKIHLKWGQKFSYFRRMSSNHFGGFLITALAISLGAPFWFDLLNKLMKLRTSVKHDTDTTDTTSKNTSRPKNRDDD